jgi:hypothetical protein
MSLSLPPLTVTSTWTGPQRVWTTGPVTVREDAAVVPELELEAPAVEGGGEATVAPVVASGPASEVR